MKDLKLLVWLTQLGLSAVFPLAGFLILGLWLHRGLGWGVWTVLAGVALGILCGIRSLWDSLKLMERMSSPKQDPDTTVSFNRHE